MATYFIKGTQANDQQFNIINGSAPKAVHQGNNIYYIGEDPLGNITDPLCIITNEADYYEYQTQEFKWPERAVMCAVDIAAYTESAIIQYQSALPWTWNELKLIWKGYIHAGWQSVISFFPNITQEYILGIWLFFSGLINNIPNYIHQKDDKTTFIFDTEDDAYWVWQFDSILSRFTTNTKARVYTISKDPSWFVYTSTSLLTYYYITLDGSQMGSAEQIYVTKPPDCYCDIIYEDYIYRGNDIQFKQAYPIITLDGAGNNENGSTVATFSSNVSLTLRYYPDYPDKTNYHDQYISSGMQYDITDTTMEVHFDETFEIRWPNTVTSANPVRIDISTRVVCLYKDTLILMADGSQKEIQYIKLGDKIKTPYGIEKVTMIKHDFESPARGYYKYQYKGAELKIIGDHCVEYNGKFVHISEIPNVSKEHIHEICEPYSIYTNKTNTYYANGILCGTVLSNRKPRWFWIGIIYNGYRWLFPRHKKWGKIRKWLFKKVFVWIKKKIMKR